MAIPVALEQPVRIVLALATQELRHARMTGLDLGAVRPAVIGEEIAAAVLDGAVFMQFAAFDQDAIDNQQFLAKGKLPMPVLAIGGEKSFGTTMAKIMT